MEVVEEKLTVLGTLEAFIMLKTPPGERVGEVYPGWAYMHTVDSDLERRMLARMDRRSQKKGGIQ